MTATRLLRLVTVLSADEVATILSDGRDRPTPSPADPSRYHMTIFAGRADAHVSRSQPGKLLSGSSSLIRSSPNLDVWIDYDRHWEDRLEITELLANLVVRLLEDDRFTAGVLVDPELAALCSWEGRALRLYEPDAESASRRSPSINEEVTENSYLFTSAIEDLGGRLQLPVVTDIVPLEFY